MHNGVATLFGKYSLPDEADTCRSGIKRAQSRPKFISKAFKIGLTVTK